MIDGPTYTVQFMEYVATDAVRADIDRDTLDSMVVMAEQARANRNCDIHKEKMYMIRMQQPPSPRLIAVIFLEDMDGFRKNFVLYYDEIEHCLARGFETGDIKKYPGTPFV